MASPRRGKIRGMDPLLFPAPTEADIQRVLHLVLETVHPLRVVLFGSAARGEQRDGSDLDILVVVRDGVDELRTAQQLYRAKSTRGIVGVPVDFVVIGASRYEQRKSSLWTVFGDAAREGRELYAS